MAIKTRRQFRKHYSEEELDFIIKEYNSGKNPQRIADMVNKAFYLGAKVRTRDAISSKINKIDYKKKFYGEVPTITDACFDTKNELSQKLDDIIKALYSLKKIL